MTASRMFTRDVRLMVNWWERIWGRFRNHICMVCFCSNRLPCHIGIEWQRKWDHWSEGDTGRPEWEYWNYDQILGIPKSETKITLVGIMPPDGRAILSNSNKAPVLCLVGLCHLSWGLGTIPWPRGRLDSILQGDTQKTTPQSCSPSFCLRSSCKL